MESHVNIRSKDIYEKDGSVKPEVQKYLDEKGLKLKGKQSDEWLSSNRPYNAPSNRKPIRSTKSTHFRTESWKTILRNISMGSRNSINSEVTPLVSSPINISADEGAIDASMDYLIRYWGSETIGKIRHGISCVALHFFLALNALENSNLSLVSSAEAGHTNSGEGDYGNAGDEDCDSTLSEGDEGDDSDDDSDEESNNDSIDNSEDDGGGDGDGDHDGSGGVVSYFHYIIHMISHQFSHSYI